jgi:hypothetical protein
MNPSSDLVDKVWRFCASRSSGSGDPRQSLSRRTRPQDPSDEPAEKLLEKIKAARAAPPARKTRKKQP